MARKVFISVLGTGFYGKCIYKRDEFESGNTRFIQQATLQMLTNSDSWTSDDHGYILLTQKAEVDNWIVKGDEREKFSNAGKEEYIGLEKTIGGMNLPFAVEGISIPDGNDEKTRYGRFSILCSKNFRMATSCISTLPMASDIFRCSFSCWETMPSS